MSWRIWERWKRRKAPPRPTEPDKSAHSPKPPISNPATNASTASSGCRISADDAGSHGPVGSSAIVQQTPATASPPVVENDGSASKTPLWIRAYNAICEDDPELVAAYKAVLSSKLRPEAVCDMGADGDDDAENARQEMDRQVQEGLRRTEKAGAKMDKIHEGMRVASSVKELISTAAKHAPEAAAAWAGICLLFAILENPLSESKAFRDGISHVVSRMDWYWRLSKLLETTHAETSGMRDELQGHIGDLYKKLLSHQMKSVCSLFRGTAATIARDMVKLDDWENALQSVRDAEAVVQRDIDTFHNAEVRTLLNDISKQARDQHAQLQDIGRAIRETDQNQEERQQDKRTKKCLADLRLTDPRDDMRRIEDTKGGLFRGASNWILSSDDFRRWHNADDAQLLWIKGDPGKGKTMLMITIVDELERERPTTSSTALSYFFCQGTDENLNNAAAVLRGLIYILCHEQPSLASHLHARYDHAGAKLFQDANSFYALSKVLENILQDERLQRAYLAVDALDECMTDQDQLLRFIAGPGMASPRVRWLVSSRNIPKIENLLKTDSPKCWPGSKVRLSLEVTQNAEQVALAVRAFIDHKLSTVRSLQEDHKTRDQVRDVIREKANGTFLWVALVINELQKPDSVDMLEVLEELPEELEGLYDRMIQQIRNLRRKTSEFCRLVLSTAALAYRPLHLHELAIVSGLPADISDYANRVRQIVDLCGSFLTVKGDVVYLIHQSVKDYLTGRASQTIFPSGPSKIHRTMFVRSIEALSNGRLRRDMYDLKHLGTMIDNVKVPEPDPLASVQYSCVHWARHFCDANPGNSRSETEDLERIERFVQGVFLYWLEAAALLQRMSETIISIRQLEDALKAKSCNGPVMSLISDAVRFVLHNRYTIENAPLQAYVSALVFTPINSLIRKEFSYEEPTWVNLKPIIEPNWSPCMQTLEGHHSSVRSVAFSPDGQQIASGSYDYTIKVWDCKSGTCIQTLEGHSDWIHAVAFSPDGRQIASSSSDSTIKVWDCKSGACIQTLEGHHSLVYSVVFSPDGQQIVSGSSDSTIKVWDCKSGTCIQTLEGHSDCVHAVAFSPDGRQIASSSSDSTIKVWDCKSGACIQTLEGHHSLVYSVVFSPNGQQIVSGSSDCTIKVSDCKSGTCIQTLKGHHSSVHSVAFSPDGQIASGSYDCTIKVWDCKSGTCIQTLKGHSDWVNSVVFSPDGQQIVSGSSDCTIKVWDCKSGICTQMLEGHYSSVKSVVFSPDGQQIASASFNDCTIKVWDYKSGVCIQTLEDHHSSVYLVIFSPDSQQIASASFNDSTIKVWDCKSGICIQTLKGHHSSVNSVAFSPDGQRIASTSFDDSTIKVWDCKSGTCIQTLKGHHSSVESVAFSPDGQRIASTSFDDCTIKVWDCKSGTCIQTLEDHSSVYSVIFSPDGQRIASTSFNDCTIKVWDCKSGICIQTLEGHYSSVYSVAFSPDGQQIASGSYDGTIKVWDCKIKVSDCKSGTCIQTLEGHHSSVHSVTFSPDGQQIASGSGENDEHACESGYRLGYGLSADQRWICRHEQNVLWLPPDYRPSSSAVWCPSRTWTMSDGYLFESTVALGCPSGRVIVLGLADDGSYRQR